MGAAVDIPPTTTKTDRQSEDNPDSNSQTTKKNKRGRPKGARTTRLSEVRRQATEEKRQIKAELGTKIETLKAELELLQSRYHEDINRLNDEIELFKRRENSYQQALGARLHQVAEHLQKTLISWGTAELEEAQVDKRGRGRPRKTLK